MGMYKSPIELIIADIQHQIAKEQDEEIYKAVVSYIPNVDKEELLRALKYDRDQYDKGYGDGYAAASAHGRWKKYMDYFTGRQTGWICTNCSAVSSDISNGDTTFCPHCGALMDTEDE